MKHFKFLLICSLVTLVIFGSVAYGDKVIYQLSNGNITNIDTDDTYIPVNDQNNDPYSSTNTVISINGYNGTYTYDWTQYGFGYVSNKWADAPVNTVLITNIAQATYFRQIVISNQINWADQKYYPISNPAGYVNSSVINGLASTNFVKEYSYPINNPSNFVNSSVTNGVSLRVSSLESSTTEWNKASTDASAATNWIATNTISASDRAWATNLFVSSTTGGIHTMNGDYTILGNLIVTGTVYENNLFVTNIYLSNVFSNLNVNGTATFNNNIDMKGNSITNVVIPQYYQVSNPSNYVNSSVTNGVSLRISSLEGQTTAWNQAVINAAAATNFIATNTILTTATNWVKQQNYFTNVSWNTSISNNAYASGGMLYITYNTNYANLQATNSMLYVNTLVWIPTNTAPVNPVQGQVYFNSNDRKLKVYNGTTWNNLN